MNEKHQMKYYETENQKLKRSFAMILEKFQAVNGDNQNFSAIEIGSGSGDFLVLLRDHYPEAELLGVDVKESFTTLTHEKNPAIPFWPLDITEEGLPGEYDYSFMIGVHVLFDDFKWMDTVLDATRKRFFFFGIFNPVPDKGEFAHTNKGSRSHWKETNYTLEEMYNRLRTSLISVDRFVLDIPLHQQLDYISSWRVESKTGYECIRGDMIVYNLYLLQIDPKYGWVRS